MVQEVLNFNSYQNLVESIHDIVFQTNLEGDWSFLNTSWTRITGYKVMEAIGMPFYQNIHPEDKTRYSKMSGHLIKYGKEYSSYELRYVIKSGLVIWVKANVFLLKDNDGNVIGTSGTIRDITDEKRNRYLIGLYSQSTSDLICYHELNGEYKYVSPSVENMFGYEPNDLINKRPSDFFHPDDRDILIAYENKRIKAHYVYDEYISFRFLAKNGKYKWVESSSKMIKDENNIPIGYVTSSRVIDKRKKEEGIMVELLQKERHMNKMKSNFVSSVSHEFRTPLAIIRSSIELSEIYAAKVFHLIPNISKHHTDILSQIDKLTMLIDEVLTVSNVEYSGFSCKKEEYSILNLLIEIIDNADKIQKDDRKAVLKVEGTVRRVMLDPKLMAHAITNVISNAFKYSVGNLAPVVSLVFRNKDYLIKVKDFGIGIPEQDRSKIFQSFYRAENAASFEGTGLGMSIAKNCIELQNGSITLKKFSGIGAEFVIKMT